MPSTAGFVSVLHGVVLLAFVGVAATSMLAAVAARTRLRRPLVTWHRPRALLQVALGPGAFLLLVAIGFGHAWWTGRSVPGAMLVGYPVGGIFWAVATWVRRTVVVTEYGVAVGVGQDGHTVVWSGIVDYALTTREGRPHVVFLYRNEAGERRRFDLPVPSAYRGPVRDVMERKLASRFSVPEMETGDKEALDRLGDEIDLS